MNFLKKTQAKRLKYLIVKMCTRFTSCFRAYVFPTLINLKINVMLEKSFGLCFFLKSTKNQKKSDERYSKWTWSGTDIEHYLFDLNRWKEEEQKLRTFEIKPEYTAGWSPSYNDPDNSGCAPMSEPEEYEEGKEYSAEVLNDKTIKIII